MLNLYAANASAARMKHKAPKSGFDGEIYSNKTMMANEESLPVQTNNQEQENYPGFDVGEMYVNALGRL